MIEPVTTRAPAASTVAYDQRTLYMRWESPNSNKYSRRAGQAEVTSQRINLIDATRRDYINARSIELELRGRQNNGVDTDARLETVPCLSGSMKSPVQMTDER
jgi:hypothetical protein